METLTKWHSTELIWLSCTQTEIYFPSPLSWGCSHYHIIPNLTNRAEKPLKAKISIISNSVSFHLLNGRFPVRWAHLLPAQSQVDIHSSISRRISFSTWGLPEILNHACHHHYHSGQSSTGWHGKMRCVVPHPWRATGQEEVGYEKDKFSSEVLK